MWGTGGGLIWGAPPGRKKNITTHWLPCTSISLKWSWELSSTVSNKTLIMPKASSSRAAAMARRHNPLAEDITSAGHLRTQSSKKGKAKVADEEEGENGQRFVDAKMSRNILQLGQELADEDAAEQAKGAAKPQSNGAFEFDTRFEEDEAFSDDEDKFETDDWVDDEVEQVVRQPPSLDIQLRLTLL